MPEEMIDQQARETLIVGGEAANVLDADAQAWQFAESVMGRDPIEAWIMQKMEHTVTGLGKIEWVATFRRDPDVPVPPLQAREISDEEFERARAENAEQQERAADGHGPRS